MEGIRKAARAYFDNQSDRKKKNARKAFKAMDKDGDGQISLPEYEEYLKKKKAKDFVHTSIFRALDKNANESLDFGEAIVLFYLMQSGRALICKSCNIFLAGAYFSCSQCFFNDSVSTYEICCACYGGDNFTHHDDAVFCDHYTLLRQSRSAVQAAPPMRKRDKALQILKKGLLAASVSTISTSVLECISNGDDDDDSSKFSCSIM
ncbi:hypothetical protein Peur_024969 [Populus x canadensis]